MKRIRSRRTTCRIEGATLIIDLKSRRRVLSSAPHGGGLVHARYILNHAIATDQPHARICREPSRHLAAIAKAAGLNDAAVGLMTAVPMKELVRTTVKREGLCVEVFATVGVTNAVRVGETVGNPKRRAAGSINLILIVHADLTNSAMVCAVQVATEAKCAVLLANKVRSARGGAATGTGTDATVVGCLKGPRLQYSGTHTRIGELIGKAVRLAVEKGLRRYRKWHGRCA
jgi:iron complex transport system ATP-binding protein